MSTYTPANTKSSPCRRQGNDRPRRAAGFTLVELLVVIGIIALLISILMPALTRARRAAHATQCLSNLRQLTTAMIMYSTEFGGRTMPIDHNPGEYWFHKLSPYLSDRSYVDNADSDDTPTASVMMCKEAPDKSGGMGTATTAWHYFSGGGYGTYGLNLWLLPKGDFENDTANSPRENYYSKYSNVPQASDVPFIGDSIWVGSWPDYNDVVPASQTLGDNTHQRGYFMGRFYIARHGKAIQCAFVDGSARQVRLDELWQVRWHKNWVPRIVDVP